MVHDTPHWEGFGRITPQGGLQAHGEATPEMMGRSMGIYPAGRRDGRGRITGGGDLRLPPSEHSHIFYCKQDYYGPVSGGGSEAGVEGSQLVVVAGRTGYGGDVDGGWGGVTDGAGGEGGRYRNGDRYGLSRWEDNVAHLTLGTEPNSPLDYALGLEHHHMITSMFGEHGGRL